MSKPLTHQVITRARELITDPAHWAQGTSAVRKDGQITEPHDLRAWRFCATGAMVRAGFELTGDIHRTLALRDAACELLLPLSTNPVADVEAMNDARGGHPAILQLFDRHLAEH